MRSKSKFLKCGCPVKVRAVATTLADGTLGYKVTQAVLEHNHTTSALTYQAYPENRRPNVTDSVQALLNCPSISNRDLRQHIEDTQNKTTLMSDIRNLKLKVNNKCGMPDTKEVESYLKKLEDEGGVAEYGLNENGCFQYLVFMTEDMKKLLNLFPECLVLDSTYKTNVYMLPLTTVMCIDSEGSGDPVMHTFLQYEDTSILEKCLEFLKAQYINNNTSTFLLIKILRKFLHYTTFSQMPDVS